MTRPKARLALAIIAAAILTAVFLVRVRNEMADFEVNYKAGQRLAQGETLYRPSDLHWQFKYSPFSALIYLPLSFLPLPAAKAVWFFMVVAAMGILIVLSATLVSGDPAHIRFWPAVLAVMILAKFLLRELQLGQINALVTAILTVVIWLIVRDENHPSPRTQFQAGLLWGVATALKPYSLIFLPYFAVKRKARPIGVGLVTLAVTLFVPAVFYGIRGNFGVLGEWWTTLSRSTPPLLASQDNVSLLGFFSKWTGNITSSYEIFFAVTVILAGMTLAAIHRGKNIPTPGRLEGGLLLLFIPLLSPLGWDYTFLSSYAAVLLVLVSWAAFPKPARILLAANFALIGLSLYDLLGRKAFGTFMSWSVLTVDFLLVAGALFFLRWKKVA